MSGPSASELCALREELWPDTTRPTSVTVGAAMLDPHYLLEVSAVAVGHGVDV